MDTLKIVEVSHAFPPYSGGLSHVVEMLSRNLVAQGHEVEVVTLDPSGELKITELFGGAYVRRFRGIAPSNSYFVPSPRVISYLKSVKADVVHAHNIGALLVPACWLAIKSRSDGISFVISPHHHLGGSAWHTKMLWKPYEPFARHIVQSASRIHCVSKYEAQLVRKKFRCNPIIIQNGVAEDVFEHRWIPPLDNLVLTYAGRLERYKRAHVLVEAASILQRQGHDVTVRIIGEGPELPRIIRLSGLLGVNVEYQRFLSRYDYLELLSTSSFLVNPSQYEAFSIVVAEAKTIGLPVIISLPWGETFKDLPNVRLVNGSSATEIAEAAVETVSQQRTKTDSIMPWREVTNKLIEEVFRPSLSRRDY